ncbi:MAG: PilZ domain-containing protein [Desulfofustis sp.]|jgi:LysM repeat protein|nr:PilZ domain-containing protein [Desulfofustis sp.]
MVTLSQQLAGIIDRRSQHRRQHPRAAVTWPVTVLAGEDSCQGRAENISRGGALIFLNRALALQESVRLAFEIPDCRTVITATGEVVRTFSLKRGHETPFSHGVGIKFTEITEDDLKFFSGNLAPEWQKDYRELDDAAAARSPNNRIKKNTAIAAAALVCLLAGGYFFPRSAEKAGPEPFPAAAVDARLTALEEQAQSYRSVEQTLAKIGTELTAIQGELATLKNQMPDASALTAMLQRVDEQRTVIEKVSASLAQLQPPAPAQPELRPEPAARRIHIVEKGENLYRIGLKTGQSVDTLRHLNGLAADAPLAVGQKLIVE